MTNDRRRGEERRAVARFPVNIDIEWEGLVGRKAGTISDKLRTAKPSRYFSPSPMAEKYNCGAKLPITSLKSVSPSNLLSFPKRSRSFSKFSSKRCAKINLDVFSLQNNFFNFHRF